MADQERYFVEGPNGQRFGPATVDELRVWHADRRLGPSSILIQESSGKRRLASDVLNIPPDATILPPVGPGVRPPKKTNTGLIVGIIAISGLCLCAPIMGAILMPVFAQAKFAAQRTQQLSDLKQIGLGTLMYMNDYDDHFPLDMSSAMAAEPVLLTYVNNEATFKSVNPKGGEFLGNPKLSGRNSRWLVEPENTLMFYDETLWGSDALVSFADGHASWNNSPNFIESALTKTPIFGKPAEAGGPDLGTGSG